MGLDGVELVMAVEEEFQIAISDSEANECSTVRKLVELVHSRLRHSSTDPCPSQHSFYLARQKLISILHTPRQKIKPETKLDEIIPKKHRKRLWSEVTTALAESVLPQSARPTEMDDLRVASSLRRFALRILLLARLSFCLVTDFNAAGVHPP